MPDRPVDAFMSPAVVRVPADASLRDAARVMSEAGIGSVVVEADPDGLVTERDLLRPIADGTNIDEARVLDYVASGHPTIPPETPLNDAARRMVERGVRHCLVARDGETVGVLSMRDIVRLLDVDDD
jgi:isocitrate dehydrogenase